MNLIKVPFTTTIHPCIISLTVVGAPLVSIGYKLGDPSLNVTLSIVQTPACYSETVEIEITSKDLNLELISDS